MLVYWLAGNLAGHQQCAGFFNNMVNDIKKAKQRFSWQRNANKGLAIKVDSETNTALEIDGTKFPTEIAAEIFVYGVSKIIDDRLSQVSPDLKMRQAKELVAQFMSGDWKAERTGGIHLLPLVIDAIMLAKGCKAAAAQEAYRQLDDEQRIVLKSNLAESMSAIAEARKGAEIPELDDLLS
ncbi:MAG: hypothetical protein O7D34_02155 [Ignavibacteria bacterium]|nr:hypothetical protein [Ignavibacteria bacterium]